MKKFFALLLAMMMVLSCAAVASADEPVELDVIICEYGNNTREWFLGKGMNGTSFVDKFAAENPDIKLNLEVISWSDVHKEVSTRISNNNAPDILNIDTFSEFQADNLLLPVKDYCPEDLFNDFFPAFIQESVVDGTVWAVPDLASARVLYYNKTMFDEAGIEAPTTWAELKDDCQAIKDFYGDEVYPIGLDLTEDEGQATFAYFAWGNNGGFTDEEGNWALNSDANVEAVNFVMDLINSGFANPSPSTQTRYELQDLFGAGKLAMLISTNQVPQYLADKGFEVSFATTDIPHNEGATASSVGVMDRIMAFRDDSAPDQAKRNEAIGKFLKFFYAPENYVGWVSMETFLPAVNSSVGALVEADPGFELWLNVLANCRFYPAAKAEWADVRNGIVVDVEQRALTGEEVRPLLDALQTKITGK
jgi:multiple sugar transport system substrate-binding protein